MAKRLDEIREIIIVGSGLLGHGIGQAFAQKKYFVNLYNPKYVVLEEALSQIRNNLETFVEVGIEKEDRIEVKALSPLFYRSTEVPKSL